MVTSSLDPLRIPEEFWLREDVGHALDERDVGALFRLLRGRLGASQNRIGTATGLSQGTVCQIMNDSRQVRALDVLERLADGLDMPDQARMRLGLAPRRIPLSSERSKKEDTPNRRGALRAPQRGSGDTGLVWGQRRLVGCDARGVPVREEVIMAAEESARFQRWSATTNVDDAVLEQMTADVAELAWAEQIDPPASTYARLLGARDDAFRLIAGHQPPHHTTSLYKIAGQVTAMLAMVTFDLGHPHAANTHARTALHCAEVSGHTPLRVYIRWTQSSEAYWDGRYDEAAQLMEAARPDATSGTTLLLLASQQARINAARNRPDEMNQALALAATTSTEPTADEPGVLGCDAGRAALYASEAHYTLGGTDHLDAAVQWAHTALDEFTTQYRSVSARFNLAIAYLGRGDLEAVGEHLAPILHATDAEYRTVPIIGRARSLHTLLDQRTDLTSGTLTALRDDLAGFITHPAPTPPELESGTTT